jgi:rod shape-determining protein MreC
MKFGRNIWVVIGLVIFALLVAHQALNRLFVRVVHDFSHPYLNLPVQAEQIISDQSLLAESKTRLAAAVVQLRNENQRLNAENEVSKELQDENRKLRSLMSLGGRLPGRTLFADIVVRDPLNWNEQFTIGKGSDDGLQEGDLVLALGQERSGLSVVGRITRTARHQAQVLTLIHPEQRLSVTFANSGILGVMEGGFRRDRRFFARVHWLPKEEPFQIGEWVTTSGLGATEVSGLSVGKVTDFDGTGKPGIVRNRLYKEALVELDVDVSTLKTVLVPIR